MGCHFLLQGIFLTQGSLMPPALAGRFFTTSTTWEALILVDSQVLSCKMGTAALRVAVLVKCLIKSSRYSHF